MGSAPVYSLNPSVSTGSSKINRFTETSPKKPPRSLLKSVSSALFGITTISLSARIRTVLDVIPRKSPHVISAPSRKYLPRAENLTLNARASFCLGSKKTLLITCAHARSPFTMTFTLLPPAPFIAEYTAESCLRASSGVSYERLSISSPPSATLIPLGSISFIRMNVFGSMDAFFMCATSSNGSSGSTVDFEGRMSYDKPSAACLSDHASAAAPIASMTSINMSTALLHRHFHFVNKPSYLLFRFGSVEHTRKRYPVPQHMRGDTFHVLRQHKRAAVHRRRHL